MQLSQRKNEILPSAATCTDLENSTVSSVSQRRANTVCAHVHMWNLKNKQMKTTKQKQPRRCGVITGRGVGGRREKGRG